MKQNAYKRAAVEAALSHIDFDINASMIDKLVEYLDLLIEKNKTLNLTRIDDFEQGTVLHIEDSLSILNEFCQFEGDFCDIGTGAGLPGIPLGIVTGRNGVLLDSVKKKANAVEQFINALGLKEQLTAIGARSEELSQECPGSFGVVTARAVSSLPVIQELATPLLKKNGVLIAMRAQDSDEDLNTALISAEKCGLKFVSRRSFEIGNGDYFRSVCVYQKVKEPQVKLPRRPGMAVKKPLV